MLARRPVFRGCPESVTSLKSWLKSLYTASGSVQGKEVRSKFDTTFAALYRHLDDGFQPINFIMPWLPLPQTLRRDHAQKVMENLYSDIIRRRRQHGNPNGETDMIWALMDAQYKDGSIISDEHISRLMMRSLWEDSITQPLAGPGSCSTLRTSHI